RPQPTACSARVGGSESTLRVRWSRFPSRAIGKCLVADGTSTSLARGGAGRLLASRVLGVVEDVVTSAGGTEVVEGTDTLTQRLVEGAAGDYGSSLDVRRRLAGDHGWFRDLFGDATNRSRFFDGSVVEGVHVRVTELTGKAGDAYLMHPWLMHAAAPNINRALRSII